MIPRFFEMGKKGRLLVVIAALFITGSEFYFSRGDLSSPGLLVIPIILAGLGFPWKQGWVVVPVSLCIAVLRDLFFYPAFVSFSRYTIISVLFFIVYVLSAELRTQLVNLREQRDSMEHWKNGPEEVCQNMLFAFVDAIGAKDKHLAEHSKAVAHYAKGLAERTGLPPAQVQEVYYSALLHDIGKIGVRENVLNKESSLTSEEWEEIKQHPLIGMEIFSKVPQYQGLAQNILFHHVHFDGSGYPTCLLREKDIPLGARIIAIADAFDAMTSHRAYRRPLDYAAACRELQLHAGTQFDPELVEEFLLLIREVYLAKEVG